MKRLFHLSTVPAQLQWFENDWKNITDFIKKNNIEGIELGLTASYPIEQIPSDIIEGVHLSFYPMWLDFWHGDIDKVSKILGSREAVYDYYGGYDKQVIIDSYKLQYQRAKQLGAKYMVFHISHILIEDSFTFTYTYSDEEIIKASIELINEVFGEDQDGPMLLFENLWWPGLTYLNPELVQYLIEQVKYLHKGYVLDVSHLILTNPKIATELQAFNYIEKVMSNLGDLKDTIKVVHLNKTLPKHYMQRDHNYTLQKYRQTKDKYGKNRILKNHIKQMDPHQPFDHEIARKIIQLVSPDFCVYETAPSSKYELAYFIKRQNIALGI
ncbi:TIM barrel protein [Cellulosilyticum sp. I15G10I2]|uniref:TIM barrel protein n=1 Tax=Cellulosilyticum sp. I15G10I2 TaxID=1892843 RepID=UPI00085BE4DD|nr:TIM barrel protein [Cellulosilyticum sp. I15G10I2]